MSRLLGRRGSDAALAAWLHVPADAPTLGLLAHSHAAEPIDCGGDLEAARPRIVAGVESGACERIEDVQPLSIQERFERVEHLGQAAHPSIARWVARWMA